MSQFRARFPHALVAILGVCLIISCGGPSPTKSGTGRPPAAPASVEKPKPPYARPEHVRGLYLTAWSAGSTKKMDAVLAMMGRTELNSIVIDVRDAGIVYFRTGIELADKSGATRVAVGKPEKLMERLKEAKVYPIARIACFRDSFVPVARPDRAVKTADGKVWKDRAGYPWLDPYNQANWEYLASIVDYALDLGFPEIQLDYVRFPSEGKTASMVFPSRKSYPEPEARHSEVIAAFARTIRKRVHERGAVLSADVFGIISSTTKDQGIGQELETTAEPFDLICPMVYPSHYARGEYGIKDPTSSPYAIVLKSLGDYRRRLPDKALRPWLQDFSLGGVAYGAKEVRAQIKAARELGYSEYLLWNAKNRYTEAAVKDTSDLLVANPDKAAKPVPKAR
ncbi:MAG: putative glycoside hydrolase [Fimbriimonadaceae bacterium]|nr:putative glycoside hydrolase [Fimbriimonadaceae bacterium]